MLPVTMHDHGVRTSESLSGMGVASAVSNAGFRARDLLGAGMLVTGKLPGCASVAALHEGAGSEGSRLLDEGPVQMCL